MSCESSAKKRLLVDDSFETLNLIFLKKEQ